MTIVMVMIMTTTMKTTRRTHWVVGGLPYTGFVCDNFYYLTFKLYILANIDIVDFPRVIIFFLGFCSQGQVTSESNFETVDINGNVTTEYLMVFGSTKALH